MESIVLELLNKQNERLTNIECLLTISKAVLNIDEVSVLTGLSKSTIYKMTCTGLIPHYKQSKHLYFDKAEVEAWLKSNKIKTKDEIEKEASSYVTLNGKGGQK
jgi:excisionase family DNA binding protein